MTDKKKGEELCKKGGLQLEKEEQMWKGTALQGYIRTAIQEKEKISVFP